MAICPKCIPEERFALCVMFGIDVTCVEGTMLSPTEKHTYVLYRKDESGRMDRQIAVIGTKLSSWKDAIGELLSDRPQSLW